MNAELIKKYSWMPSSPLDTIYFDVDSTLTAIEGIDVLAEMAGVGDQVRTITDRCMSETGISMSAYQERLDMVKPTQLQMEQLAKLYISHITPGAIDVINALRSINKRILIVSGGIKQAILPLALMLEIPPSDVHAVNIYFDEGGNYLSFDQNSPLIQPDGKTVIVEDTSKVDKSSLLIGDGLSDLETQSVISRFVGFGGQGVRQAVAKKSMYYININQLQALLPLSLTQEEALSLESQHLATYQQGMNDILQEKVIIKESNYV